MSAMCTSLRLSHVALYGLLFLLFSSLPQSGSAAPEYNFVASDDERNTIGIFSACAPAVVFVSSHRLEQSFFNRSPRSIPSGAGTGFFWDREGHVVTNYHVIAGANRLLVTLQDGSKVEAELVGSAPNYDLAVLKIPTENLLLHTLPLGDSSRLQVGNKVLAIGNPFGFDSSLSVGVVSALGREIAAPGGRKIRNAIQTDAAINQGNSGGPLINSRGELVGVNAQIYSPSGASAGIGFAIPVNTLKRVAPQLIRDGRVSRAIMGISFAPDVWNRRVGVVSGVPVLRVYPNTPAEKAGVQEISYDASGKIVFGDIIRSIDGEPVHSTDDLLALLEWRAPGSRIQLGSERDGRSYEYDIELISDQ